ncbi:DUF29 domain-containing protein [Phormidium pseudopriestleyi FRX01]|uniref:DUF29 domain-containing protein n=1 Tax=Phormidium pseudopriestleyi FRX01 TaxID=1759528 RepID=A0ABS3FM62_9CYAN|nr:DUF29 domain-containing protein [Phormidium pseudopriestleyi]MBO0348201.1 DUF29 domain-containing protein [Phormidium pseudopriestleyi FRX01]
MSKVTKTTLKELYEIDEYLWLAETVKFLRKNRLKDLDLDNLIEELESLGKRDFNQIKSLLRQIIIHLLLLQYWREEYDRSHRNWKGEITAFRADLSDRLTTTLENKLNQNLASIYQTALKVVLQKTGLSQDTIPENCPYSFEQLLDDNWYPEV